MAKFGFIYFIYDFEKKRTKIGKTKNHPAYRLKELQTGSSTKLELIHFYETEDMSQEEKYLHEQYQQYRVMGEWFELPLPIILELSNGKSPSSSTTDKQNNTKSNRQENYQQENEKSIFGEMNQQIKGFEQKIQALGDIFRQS